MHKFMYKQIPNEKNADNKRLIATKYINQK